MATAGCGVSRRSSRASGRSKLGVSLGGCPEHEQTHGVSTAGCGVSRWSSRASGRSKLGVSLGGCPEHEQTHGVATVGSSNLEDNLGGCIVHGEYVED